MTQLTNNFTLSEFEHSDTAKARGIDNTIPQKLIPNIRALCENILQPIRDEWGVVKITSGYRSKELTVAVGSTTRSQHCNGEAADIVMPNMLDVALWVREHLEFDQLIIEDADTIHGTNPKWLHISHKRKGLNRKQTLVMLRGKHSPSGKTVYIPYKPQ